MIAVDVLDSEDSAEDVSIDNSGAALDEEDYSGLVGVGVTEEVEHMQRDLKYSSLFSYMLKPSNLLTPGFDKNRTAYDNIFKHMCNFGAWVD